MFHDKEFAFKVNAFMFKINICVLCGFEHWCCYGLPCYKKICVIKNLSYQKYEL